MFLDLHCHSKYSKDAITSPRHIAEVARQKGIVVALTDHNAANGWKDYGKACKLLGIDFVFGQEQKVYWQKEFAGELLFYFLNEEIKSKQVFEAIDEARAQDAIVSVAHPFDWFRKIPVGNFKQIEKIVGRIDAIEAFNSRCIFGSANFAARKFAERNNLAFTAGSDAHFPKEIGSAFVEAETDSLEEFRRLLLKGKVKVYGKLSSLLVHFETRLVKLGVIKKETD